MAANLLWTGSSGEVVYIEAALLPGGAGIRFTGARGEAFEDLVRTTHSYLWSRANQLAIHPRLFRRYGLHAHAPVAGDHAAAGLALTVTLVSLYNGCAVPPDLAITGATTLSGLVLPVAAIRERLIAARQAGFSRIILPRDHQKELAEIDTEGVSLIYVDGIQLALEAALPRLMRHVEALKASL